MIAQAIVVVVVAAGAAAARRAGRFGFSVFACVTSAVFVYTLSLPFSSSLVFFTQKSSNQRKRETRAISSSSLDTHFKRDYFVHSSRISETVRSRLIRELSHSLTLLLSGFREKKELAGGRHPSPPPQIRTLNRRGNRAFSAFHVPGVGIREGKDKAKER
jgi:hypothetical protein